MLDWFDNLEHLNRKKYHAIVAIPLLMKRGYDLETALSMREKVRLTISECLIDGLEWYYSDNDRKPPNNMPITKVYNRLESLGFYPPKYAWEGYEIINPWDLRK
ncbi:hypothetical protein [Vibrio barjaei]|uniref:hypothetical protein n=1 Tax=Vibrio barjaei TaxID=1676683 RepID=UPI0022836792|nr:hypothetical protein [Vibrio barjaei]MCY9870362.1 hypothetical protein [Vibrio barjaei]